jgi:hypothetical protein
VDILIPGGGVLKIFEGLKSFFLSEEKAPKTLVNFFIDSKSEAYLWFIHSQLYTFKAGIKK